MLWFLYVFLSFGVSFLVHRGSTLIFAPPHKMWVTEVFLCQPLSKKPQKGE